MSEDGQTTDALHRRLNEIVVEMRTADRDRFRDLLDENTRVLDALYARRTDPAAPTTDTPPVES